MQKESRCWVSQLALLSALFLRWLGDRAKSDDRAEPLAVRLALGRGELMAQVARGATVPVRLEPPAQT